MRILKTKYYIDDLPVGTLVKQYLEYGIVRATYDGVSYYDYIEESELTDAEAINAVFVEDLFDDYLSDDRREIW